MISQKLNFQEEDAQQDPSGRLLLNPEEIELYEGVKAKISSKMSSNTVIFFLRFGSTCILIAALSTTTRANASYCLQEVFGQSDSSRQV